jgi:hypothetical protein
MADKYNIGHKIDKHLPLQDPPKFTQIGIFWFENVPSGKPSNLPAEAANELAAIVRQETGNKAEQGCQMVYFSYQKSHFGNSL